MWGWNHQIWEKNKGTTECEKRTITCDVETTQYEDGTVKCEKKSKGTTQCDKRTITCVKNRADAMLELFNMTMEPSNLRKKNKGTTICDKRTVKCDIETIWCDNGTVKCEKK